MSSIPNYTPGGYIAKFTQSVAEESANRKKQSAALQAAVDSIAKEEAAVSAESTEATETAATETGSASDSSPEEKLAGYKKDFQKNIRSLTLNRHFILTNISLNIDDAGYKKMMNDPAYEQKVMGLVREKMGSVLTAAPASVTVNVDAKGEKIEAVADDKSGSGSASSILGLTSNLKETTAAARSGTGLDALTSQVSAVLSYRLGSDPMGRASALLNHQA